MRIISMSRTNNVVSGLPLDVSNFIIEIGSRIELARKKREMTQEQLAKAVYCSRQAIARLEHGDPRASIATLFSVIFCLNMLKDVRDFLHPTKDTVGNFLVNDKLFRQKRTRKKHDPYWDF